MPERIQLSRAKGWRLPENTVKVARPGRWGNPYKVGEFGRGLAITLFRNSLDGCWSPGLFDGMKDDLIDRAYAIHREQVRRVDLASVRRELRGKHLACWCKPGEACHADVLLDIANEPLW